MVPHFKANTDVHHGFILIQLLPCFICLIFYFIIFSPLFLDFQELFMIVLAVKSELKIRTKIRRNLY